MFGRLTFVATPHVLLNTLSSTNVIVDVDGLGLLQDKTRHRTVATLHRSAQTMALRAIGSEVCD